MTLPASTAVATFLPDVVDIVERHCPAYPGSPIRAAATLCRIGGSPLDTSCSLADSSIEDGDVLVLTYAEPRPATFAPFDPARTIAAASTEDSAPPAVLTMTAWGATGVATLMVAEMAGARWSAVVAAGFAAIAIGRALARGGSHPWPSAVLLTLLCAVGGVSAVPGDPAQPHVLLGITAGAVAAVVSAHLVRCPVRWTVAVIVVATAAVVSALGSVLFPDGAAVVGVALTLVALGGLCCSARATLLLGAVSTPHAVAAGLAIGWSTAAGIGVALTSMVAAHDGEQCLATAVFAAVVAVALLLRTRLATADPYEIFGGVLCAGAAAVVVALQWPGCGVLLAPIAVVVAVAGTAAPPAFRSPSAARFLDLLTHAALAATVPLAVWVCQLYPLVRGWAVP